MDTAFMDKITINRETFTNALDEIVAEAGGDYVYVKPDQVDRYGGCRYVVGGKASCLMARALTKLGVPTDWLAEHEGTSIGYLLEQLGITDKVLRIAADEAQQAQDDGLSWGECVALFKATLTRM